MYYIGQITREGNDWLIDFAPGGASGCQTSGGTLAELKMRAKQALEGWLEAWLVTGEAPPLPTWQQQETHTEKDMRLDVSPDLASRIEQRRAELAKTT